MVEIQSKLIELLKSEAKPAMGCTEPVAIAVAAFSATEYLGKVPEKLEVRLSLNVYKNAHGVKVPKVNETGTELAASLGCFAPKPTDLLTIFENITEEHIEKAREFCRSGNVSVTYVEEWKGLVIEATAYSQKDKVISRIEDGHTNIVLVKKNDETVFVKEKNRDEKLIERFEKYTIMEFIKLIETIPVNELRFLKEAAEINKNVCQIGMEKELGLKIGAKLNSLISKGILSNDLINRIKMMTAAGADARMSGYDVSVITSGGSGNQGIALFVSLALVAEAFNVPEERLVKALAIGHGINVFTKNITGKLMSVCGCAVGTGIGVTAGTCWMLEGSSEAIMGSIDNFISDLMGMLCDGAKESCSFKLASAAGEAVLMGLLALEGAIVTKGDALIGLDSATTFENLKNICNEGMTGVDSVICKIIS